MTDKLPQLGNQPGTVFQPATETFIPTFSDQLIGGEGDDQVLFLGGDRDRLGREVPDFVTLRYDTNLHRYEFTNMVWDVTGERFLTEVIDGDSNITGATNIASGLISIQSKVHGLVTGNEITITEVKGNTAANGSWTVTKVDNDNFTLNSSTGNAAYTSGGNWTRRHDITGAANLASGLINITSPAHGLVTGDEITITGVGGNTAANGTWTITKGTGDNTFTLNNSTGNAAYTSGTGKWAKTVVGDYIVYQQHYMFYQTRDVERTVIATQDGDDVVRADANFQFAPIDLPEGAFPTIDEDVDTATFEQWGIKRGDFEQGAHEAILDIRGGDGNDRLYGGFLGDTIDGGAGRDVIVGGGGSDKIFGGGDQDNLFGGSPTSTDDGYPALGGPETDTTEVFQFPLAQPFLVTPPEVFAGIDFHDPGEHFIIENSFALEGDVEGDKLSEFRKVGDFNGDEQDDFLASGNDFSYLLFGPLDLDSVLDVAEFAEIIIDHQALGQPADRFGDVNDDSLADMAFIRRDSTTVTIVLGNRTANGLVNTDSLKGAVATPWPRNWNQAFVDSTLVARSGDIADNTDPAGQAITIKSTGHGLVTGDTVVISGIAGNTAANGTWNITRLDQDQFILNGSTGNADSQTGGRWQEPINSHTIQIADHEISPTANISVQFFNMDGDRFDDLLVIGDDTTAVSGGKRNLGYIFSGETIRKSDLSPLRVVDAAAAIRSTVGLTDLQTLVAGDIDGNGHEDLVFGDRHLQVETSRVTPAHVKAVGNISADPSVLSRLTLGNGASVSGNVLTMTNDQYADISSSVLGDWGTNDFELSLRIKSADGSDKIGDPSRDYGSLIQRSTSEMEAGGAVERDGPMIFLYDNGTILFRLRDSDRLIITNAVSSWNDWVKLKFVLNATDKTLKVFVNDEEKGSHTLTQWEKYIGNSDSIVNTKMRLGGHWNDITNQNLNAKIKNLLITPLVPRETNLTISVNDESETITVKEIVGAESAQTAAAYAPHINQLLQSQDTPLKDLIVVSDDDGHLQISTTALGNTVKLNVSEDEANDNLKLGFESASVNTFSSGNLAENDDTKITVDSPVSHALDVGDLGSVLDVNVTVTLTHNWVADVDIELRGPDNQEVQLACNNGGSSDNFTGTIFDDEASNDIRSGTGPFSGSYRPCDSLSAFKDGEAQGAWTLVVTDSASGDDGYLKNWNLELKTAANEASGTTTPLSTFPSDNPILFNGRVSGKLEITLGQKDGTSPDLAFPFALGDLNNDGYDDFALSNKSDSRLNVYNGMAVTPSTENFTAGQNFTIHSSPPIEITSTAHGLVTGDIVEITGVGGNTNANGTWTVTRVDSDKFTLNSSTGNTAYTGGGIWTKQHAITAATNPANGTIEITSTAHGLVTGNEITIAGVGGNTNANGTWTVTRVDSDKFTLNSSTANAAYTSGGHWTREYSITGATNPAGGTGSVPNIGTLSTGLVAYYPLENGSGTTTTDRIGSNNGALKGNVTWTSGKLNGGLEFNRTADSGPFTGSAYQSGWIEANGLLDGIGASGILNDTDSYTFSAWGKWAPQASGAASYGYTIWGANTTHDVNANVMRVGIDNDADSLFAHGDGDLGSVNWADQKWHLYTITFGPDGNADFYVDGAIKVTKAQDSTDKEREKLWSTAGLFHFGMEMDENIASDGWSGKLDELAIWNRELSAPEISALYNNGAGVILDTRPPIEITSAAHGLVTGDKVAITGVGGNSSANGTWAITRGDTDKFTLDNSSGNAAYSGGGHWIRLHDIIGATHPKPLAATSGDFDGDGAVDLAVSLVKERRTRRGLDLFCHQEPNL